MVKSTICWWRLPHFRYCLNENNRCWKNRAKLMIYHEHRKQHRYKDKDKFCLSEALLWILFDWWLYFQYRKPDIDCYSYQDWKKTHACKNCVVYRWRLRHITAGTLRNPFLDLMNIIVRLAISVQRQIRIVINRLNFEDSGIFYLCFDFI